MPTQDEFYTALHGFLPDGLVWPDPGEVADINTLVESLAAATKDMDDDATTEFEDIFPDETTNYLDDWERVLELPKSFAEVEFFIASVGKAGDPLGSSVVVTPTPANDQQRRDIIGAMLNNDPLNNAAFYEDLAAVFSLTISVQTGVTPLEAQITVLTGAAADIDLFSAQAIFFKPAHTKLFIA